MEYELLMCAETKEMHRQILEGFAQNLPTTNKTVDNTVRYCDKCRLIKPDRTHHCSVCGECILKMDHHCPWINNCVNFTNYKCFILFLGYALLYCIYVSLTSLQYFIAFWKVNKFTAILNCFNGKFVGRFAWNGAIQHPLLIFCSCYVRC